MVEGFYVRVLITSGQDKGMGYELIKNLRTKNIYFIIAEMEKGNSPFQIDEKEKLFSAQNQKELSEILLEHQINCVIHLSNASMMSNKMADSFDQSESNITRTIEVLEACVQANVQ